MKSLEVKINHNITTPNGSYDMASIRLVLLLSKLGLKSNVIQDVARMQNKMHWWKGKVGDFTPPDTLVMPRAAYDQIVGNIKLYAATKMLANRNSINSMIGALKELYDPVITQQLVYGNNPFLSLIPSKDSFSGKK